MEAAVSPQQHRSFSGRHPEAAGFENVKGITPRLTSKIQPIRDGECRPLARGVFCGQNYPTATRSDARSVYGPSIAAMVQVLKHCGDEPAPETVMKQPARLMVSSASRWNGANFGIGGARENTARLDLAPFLSSQLCRRRYGVSLAA